MMYICACVAAPFAPLAWISSRMVAAKESPRPLPPYCSGIRQDR
jgi:hypothetical protein